MAGLVTYQSSDEEEETFNGDEEMTAPENLFDHGTSPVTTSSALNGESTHTGSGTSASINISPPALVGPILGPSRPVEDLAGLRSDERFMPQSPYSANRAALQDLTLPSIPNFEIPPSPPGSPIASTNAKFKHFLELKRKGVHFNDSLSKSSALKNPSVTQQLLDFSDVDEAGQYATTLSKEFWDPVSFPAYAYKEALSKTQQKIFKKRESEKTKGSRDLVDFVPASVSDETSKPGTPKISQKSTAERIMAGLDRGRSNSPQVQGLKRKSRFET